MSNAPETVFGGKTDLPLGGSECGIMPDLVLIFKSVMSLLDCRNVAHSGSGWCHAALSGGTWLDYRSLHCSPGSSLPDQLLMFMSCY